jgi:hypothetical protein
MRHFTLAALAAACALGSAGTADAAVFGFTTDPFAGSTALTTPGRQVVGGEPSITFNIATDSFAFDPVVFGISEILFANNIAGNLPTGGVNVIVLRSFDDDANAATAFGAGSAATLIAAQLTAPGPGFFVYFNSGLDLARLVFSTDLSDPTADLKIIARMTNLAGQAGRDSFPLFTSANFIVTPVPPAFVLMAGPVLVGAARAFRRRKTPA